VLRSSWGFSLFPGTLCASALFECLLLQVCWRPRGLPCVVVVVVSMCACVGVFVAFLLRAFSLVCGNFRHWFRF